MRIIILSIIICSLGICRISAAVPDSLGLAGQQAKLTAALKEADLKLAERQQAWLDAQQKKVKYDSIGLAQYRYEMSIIKQERKNRQIDFIRQHPDYKICLTALTDVIGHLPDDIKAYDILFNGLNKDVQQSEEGLKVRNTIDRYLKVAIGAQAPVFTANDTIGNPIRLEDYRGKYVLLDFWASWCMPCREENPVVVKAYHEYKSKNFEILSVSLDESGKRDAWIKAIHADSLDWKGHVSDLKGWNNGVAQLYSVRSIPQNFLIDPQGKIIAVNMRGKALVEKLKELLN